MVVVNPMMTIGILLWLIVLFTTNLWQDWRWCLIGVAVPLFGSAIFG